LTTTVLLLSRSSLTIVITHPLQPVRPPPAVAAAAVGGITACPCHYVNLLKQTDRQTPIDWPFFRSAWVSRHQKGSTNLDFNESGNDAVVVASVEPYTNHLHLASDR